MDSKNSNNRFNRDFQNSLDLDNFDVADDTDYKPDIRQKEKNPLDYGDNFDEFSDDINNNPVSDSNSKNADNSDISSYSVRKNPNASKGGKLSKNKKIALAFTAAAVVCLVIAVIFACAQCSNDKKSNTAVSVPSLSIAKTTAEPDYTYAQGDSDNNNEENETDAEPEEEVTQPQQETQAKTEAPAPTKVQPQTEAETEPQPQTEPTEQPQETEPPSSETVSSEQ